MIETILREINSSTKKKKTHVRKKVKKKKNGRIVCKYLYKKCIKVTFKKKKHEAK